jgi:hypothetical protein
MGARRTWLVAGGAALAGCILPEPNYDETRFRCESPSLSCPDGFTCVAGWCEPSAAGSDDADASPEPPDDDEDPEPLATLDAAPDEADARPIQTASFGERLTADFTGVTTDTTLKADAPNSNLGADDIIGIDADPVHIGLLRFDLGELPADAEVLAAELDLYAGNPIENGQYEVHVMLLSWSANQATYQMRNNGQDWPEPGAGIGSFAPTPIATLVADAIGDYTIPLPAAAVQDWVTSPATNYGLRWSANSPEGRGGNFDSSECDTDARRPLLRITYR